MCAYENAKGDQCDSCGNVYNAVQLVSPKCSICGSQPEKCVSDHVFLDLPKIQTKLEGYVNESVKNRKWSTNCVKLTEALLKTGLKHRCITRDLKWGTQVPLEGFEKKVF